MKGLCTICNKEIPDAIIINTNLLSMSMYMDYKENNTGKCIRCYMKNKNNQLIKKE